MQSNKPSMSRGRLYGRLGYGSLGLEVNFLIWLSLLAGIRPQGSNLVKQPDMAVGFGDLEDWPFAVVETGVSNSGTLTCQRVQSWLSESNATVRLSKLIFADVRYDWG